MANANIVQGIKEQAEALKKKEEANTTNIDLSENREMTGAEKDQHMLDMTEAINTLTQRLEAIEKGDANNG